MTAASQWRAATVVNRERAAEDIVSIRMEPRDRVDHQAGQHYEVRFPKGALSRKFSIVSSPATLPTIELGVQILPTGQVSPRLARVAVGDKLEIRGPLGCAFVWTPETSKNLLLLGAGAGITPLLSMWRKFHEEEHGGTCRFVVSAKTPERIYRYRELRSELDIRLTATGPRLSLKDLETILSHMPRTELSVRICGPSGFISSMVDNLVALGVDERRIRSEGFA